MRFKDYVTSVYNTNSVVQNGYIELENREIHHDYWIDSNGEIIITVNGDKLNELVTEPLFRNTFNTFGSS